MVPSDAAQPPRNEYVEDGATLVHAINFTFIDQTEIIVRRILADGTELVLANPADYTVAGGAGATGSITKAGVGTLGATIQIDRDTPLDQLTDYAPGDDFPAESHEEALDKLTRIAQEQRRDLLSREDVRDLIAELLVAGGGISLTIDDAGDTITIANAFDAEYIRDRVGELIVAGAGIDVLFDDATDRLVISVEGMESLPDCVKLSGDAQTNDGAGSGTLALTGEQIQDLVGAMIQAGAGIDTHYDDATGTVQIINTIGAGYTDEQVRDVVGALLANGTNLSITVDDAGNIITINCTALDASYRGLAVVTKAGAFAFDDTHGGKSILYTGGAAAATLANNAVTGLSDGWGTLVRNVGAGTLTLNLGGSVSIMVNGAIVTAASVAIAIGGVCHINRWGVDDFTAVGPKVTAA